MPHAFHKLVWEFPLLCLQPHSGVYIFSCKLVVNGLHGFPVQGFIIKSCNATYPPRTQPDNNVYCSVLSSMLGLALEFLAASPLRLRHDQSFQASCGACAQSWPAGSEKGLPPFHRRPCHGLGLGAVLRPLPQGRAPQSHFPNVRRSD